MVIYLQRCAARTTETAAALGLPLWQGAEPRAAAATATAPPAAAGPAATATAPAPAATATAPPEAPVPADTATLSYKGAFDHRVVKVSEHRKKYFAQKCFCTRCLTSPLFSCFSPFPIFGTNLFEGWRNDKKMQDII